MFGWFNKKVHTVAINGEITLSVASNDTILNSALQSDVRLPHSCKVGGCGTCKCRLVEGRVRQYTDTSYLLSAEELKNNVILLCQSSPRSDIVLQHDRWRSNNGKKLAGRTQAENKTLAVAR